MIYSYYKMKYKNQQIIQVAKQYNNYIKVTNNYKIK